MTIAGLGGAANQMSLAHYMQTEATNGHSGVTTNDAMTHGGVNIPITGQDQSVLEAIAAPLPYSPTASLFDTAAAIAQHQANIAIAYAHETARSGLIGALDLPGNYKDMRAGQLVVKPQSPEAQKVASQLAADPQAMATLQANADLGMAAAREMLQKGMTKEQLFASNPNLAKAYAGDPAFHEGFDAYAFAATHSSAGELAAIDSRLEGESAVNHRTLALMGFRA